jgi:hypothetical protein
MKIYGVFQRLRERFLQMNEDGSMVCYPRTVLENKTLNSAIRSAIHIYGNPREDSISLDSWAQAVIRVQEEISAIRWVMSNPQYSASIAAEQLDKMKLFSCLKTF